MLKYITLFIVTFLMIGCVEKAKSTNATTTKQTITQKVKESKKVVVKRASLPEGFKETKKLRPLESNVPATCEEWSDGCNTCERAGNKQASCTIYTCEKKGPFSCLKWQ